MKAHGRILPMAVLMILAVVLDRPIVLGGGAASPAGFIAGMQGKGYISRERDTIMISGMDLLYPGDTVQVMKGSKARISLCGSKGYEIRGGAVCIIRGSSVVFKKGGAFKTYAVDRKACNAAIEVFRKGETNLPSMVKGERRGTLILRSRKKSERRGVYVVRGRKQLPSIEMYVTRLIPRKPAFHWSPVEGRTSYRIVIRSGEETLWSSTVTKNRCEYPEDAPRFTEGRHYEVEIEAVSEKGDVMARGIGALSLYSKEEMESLRRDESSIEEIMPADAPERHILLGKLYEARGQLDDALSSYEKALSLDAGNTGLKERITLLKKNME